MKTIKAVTAVGLALMFVVAPFAGCAAEKKSEKAKAYPLDTCLVSGEKLGEMGKPFVFVHEGQEIKLCCKSCKKDFDKDPAKYLKKIQDAEAAKKK
jgi:YHS domain-containing protein